MSAILFRITRMEKLRLVLLVYLLILLTACSNSDNRNEISKPRLEFEVLGHMYNQEIRDHIWSMDTIKYVSQEFYFAMADGLHRTLGYDYLIVRIINNSVHNCHCGIGYNGFLSTYPTVLLDSLEFSPQIGILPKSNVGTSGSGLSADTIAVIPSKSSRFFLVIQPTHVEATSNNPIVGYIHSCALVDENGLPIDSLNSRYILKYFVSDYNGNIRIVEWEQMGEIMSF